MIVEIKAFKDTPDFSDVISFITRALARHGPLGKATGIEANIEIGGDTHFPGQKTFQRPKNRETDIGEEGNVQIRQIKPEQIHGFTGHHTQQRHRVFEYWNSENFAIAGGTRTARP